MSKTLLALAAATSIIVSVLTAPPAEARCKGCVVGAGVAASVATGFMVGSAIANTFLAFPSALFSQCAGCGADYNRAERQRIFRARSGRTKLLSDSGGGLVLAN
jgi:hypothetical protein